MTADIMLYRTRDGQWRARVSSGGQRTEYTRPLSCRVSALVEADEILGRQLAAERRP